MALLLSRTTKQPGGLDPSSWLDRHGDYLFRYALFCLRNPEAAEEALQETLLAAMKGHGDFRGESSERTWLVGILRHKVLDWFREATQLRSIDDLDEIGELDFHENGHWRADSAPLAWYAKPNELIEQEEFWEVFNQALSFLPQRTAMAFILREIDGLDTDEICEALSLSRENLWVMLHRARLALRKFLQANWFAAPIPAQNSSINSGRAGNHLPVPPAVSFTSHERLTV